MFDLLRYVLILFGVVYLITCAGILAWFRLFVYRASKFLGYLVYCSICMSFWIGAGLALAGGYPFETLLHITSDGPGLVFVTMAESGFVSMGLVSLWSAFTDYNAFNVEIAQGSLKEDDGQAGA